MADRRRPAGSAAEKINMVMIAGIVKEGMGKQ